MWWMSIARATVLRHAVIVGANDGGTGLEPLRYAELDATRIAEVLVEIGGFDVAQMDVLYAPTPEELREALHRHNDIASSFDEDLFFFYYSGHADTRGLRVGNEIYSYESLRADIRAMPAEAKVGVLDACRSGTITRLKGAALSQPFLVEDRLAEEGEAWLTAANADEAAQESDQLRSSFFTHYLLSGLRGAADTGDGEVSLSEVKDYAYARVVEHTGGTEAGAQHPIHDFRLTGAGSLALTRVADGRATVTLPADLEGPVAVIRMPDRIPVAEVSKHAGTPVRLALSPGTYRFRIGAGKDLRTADVQVFDGSRVEVVGWHSTVVEVGSTKGPGFARDGVSLARQGADEGVSWFRDALLWRDMRHSPLMAGAFSTGLPGVGQLYNGEPWKAALYFGGTFAFLGTSLLVPGSSPEFWTGSITGPNFLRLGAAMFYGAAIADAAYSAQSRESFRPVKGLTVATHADWNALVTAETPWVAGVDIDWVIVKGVSAGLDRLGWTRSPDGVGTVNFGSQFGVAIEGRHVRPGAFAALGFRMHAVPGDVSWMPVVGAGANVRWYITPRYFIEHEARVETEGGPVQFVYGGGLGIHFGG